MKGFPNQIADLGKLAKAMQCIVRLVDQGQQAKDDGILGEALVRAGVAGTGHTPMPVDRYLRQQRTKPPSSQSFRTTARGLRELFRLLGFIDDSGPDVEVTDSGRQAAAHADAPMNAEQLKFWRHVILNMSHAEDGDATVRSHPYQVLLRLVARKPGITRAKCALALEARDDSSQELDRIVALADLPEAQIRDRIGVTEPNWDNAKKVLPKFAEQLRDVVRTGYSFRIADAPGRADAGAAAQDAEAAPVTPRAVRPRTPRTSRNVTPETIGQAGIAERFDEVEIPPTVDPTVLAAAQRARSARLRRHNLLVRELATRFPPHTTLYEDPFDVLALVGESGILVEVKTLDGSAEDERERVREALSQLLYYEAFLTPPVAGGVGILKIACFEHRISSAHAQWLNRQGIGVIWRAGTRFAGDALAASILGPFMEEMR